MRRCLFQQISRRDFTDSSRLHSLSSEVGVLRDEPDGPVKKSWTAEVAPEDNGGATNSEPAAAPNTSSAPRRPLPLSPLMDPEFLAARAKHRLPKPRPTGPLTPFQQELAKNPYALALASKKRRCALTRTTLPAYFLQDFESITHPETNEAWFMPRSLTSKFNTRTEKAAPEAKTHNIPKTSTAHEPPVAHDVETETNTVPASSNLSLEGNVPARPTQTCTLGARGYILHNQAILAVSNTKAGYIPTFFLQSRSRDWKDLRLEGLRWRSDIATFMLNLQRKRIVESLQHAWGLKRGYLVKCKDLENAKARKQVAAILWAGPGDFSETPSDMSTNEPGEYATVDLEKEKRSKVPVHNLQTLLGSAHVADLRNSAGIHDSEWVVLKHKRVTIGLQLKLWKLQGYLAKYEVPIGVAEDADFMAEDEDDAFDDDEDAFEEDDDEEEEEEQPKKGPVLSEKQRLRVKRQKRMRARWTPTWKPV